ncbi:gliding motility protein GldM [Parapedobacter sp. ISTM3]|uniref:Gliding motility-associated protein GldM n=1 Tax=Parapedobacter luteus TaxID=623280 RepID=A0A1T5EMT4_9SPHI|nr:MULTISPECIES: gliding motility protein GldM [Parapedobacter]MBK1441301.1 gliding motility protein GldM [Parapedobacter sp. ISTM3]SKB85118.1 gliding motility-associated protein GldM [Parapedobacter luteus]
MAAGKQTPRQRMMGILYLVLLGLVALNVSDSVLDAFKNLEISLGTSTKNTQEGIDNMFNAFRATKLKDEPDRAQPILNKAEQATQLANNLSNYIDSLKTLLELEGGGQNEATGDVRKRDNLSISPRIMIKQKEKRAEKLRNLINETREQLLALSNNEVTFSLDAQDPPSRGGIQKSWEQANFGDGIPLTAAITALEKIKADVKNAEAAVVKHIFGEMDMAVVNLDRFAAVAVAPSSYIIQGQPYTAKVFLTAYDSKSNPEIFVGNNALPVTDGQATYSVNTSSEGVFNWTGTIRVKQTDGTVKEYVTEPQTYQVARPSAVVSPDAMNVLYIGVDNPISVSAPGIPKESLAVSGEGVSVSGSGGKYVARVTQPGTASINVSARIGDQTQSLGSTNFRVKRIPKPQARVAGRSGGAVAAAQIKGQNRIFAALDDFEFDAKFNISRFSMLIQKPRVDPMGPYQGTDGTFSGPMQNALSSVSPGSFVFFYNIIAVGPDGIQQELDPISFRIN